MKKFIVFISIFLIGIPVQAMDVAGLKQLCPAGGKRVIGESLTLEGVVVSDWRSQNTALNPNLTHEWVDISVNGRTVYLQDPDGKAGVCLLFNAEADNQLCRGDRVTFQLRGCTLEHLSQPDRVIVSNLSYLNIIEYTKGTKNDVPAKPRHIADLTDDDYFTLVQLQDVELVFKDGCYTDIYEGYALPTEGYVYDGFYPNARMDGWASLLRDVNGKTLYMHVNTRCIWRRTGKPLPQGTGSVTGIIVYEPMRRYGGEMGRYSIRPADDSDIALSKKKNSPWKVLTGWELDGASGQTLEFEMMGVVDGLHKEGKKDDRVLNDCGKAKGFFWTDSGANIFTWADLNALTPTSRGELSNGSILFKSKTADWFVYDKSGKVKESRSFFVEFDASKVKGTDMTFSFSWIEGVPDADYNWNYPGEWKVQMTIDEGLTWMDLKETATQAEKILLRTHPWYDKKLTLIKVSKKTGFDCGLGMQQRCFTIPASAFGQKAVILRLTPASDKLAAIRSTPSQDVLTPPGKPSPKMQNRTFIRFGKILIEYK